MKTFEDEYKELLTWYFEEREKIDKMSFAWNGGLDGEEAEAIKKLGHAYRAKLNALKIKYNEEGQ